MAAAIKILRGGILGSTLFYPGWWQIISCVGGCKGNFKNAGLYVFDDWLHRYISFGKLLGMGTREFKSVDSGGFKLFRSQRLPPLPCTPSLHFVNRVSFQIHDSEQTDEKLPDEQTDKN